MLHTHKPMTDEAIKAMQARIAARAEICKRVLGENYICHPVRHVKRKQSIIAFYERPRFSVRNHIHASQVVQLVTTAP